MSTLNVYSYSDAAGFRKYADFNDVVFSGTWSSSGSYYASAMQVANYGQSQYLCITDNVNRNPAIQPTKWQPTRYWSPFVLAVAGSGTGADNFTYQVAISGSNTAVLAYNIALAALSSAQEASALAQAGTNTANAALSWLSTGWSGTATVWAAGSLGGPTNSQLTFVNGILTAYVP